MYNKHRKTSFKALEPFLKVVEQNDGYAKFTSEGFMDLVIEKTWEVDPEGNPVYSICQYGEMNGDLMRDPEMTFGVDWNQGTVLPLSYRNDYLGINIEYIVYRNGKAVGYLRKWLCDGDEFLWVWGKDIKDQGFSPEKFKAFSFDITEWNI